jgi:hypothetical protein
VLGQDLNVAVVCLEKHPHMAKHFLAFVGHGTPKAGLHEVEFLPGRQRRDGPPKFILGGQRWQKLLDSFDPVIETFDTMIETFNPAIETVETRRDDGVVHGPDLPRIDGGETSRYLNIVTRRQGACRRVTDVRGLLASAPRPHDTMARCVS